ncbi:hypothetical protein TNCV_3517301 [Trichonephila clavipes]|nr:hypothetical protein TNCV_3517301 [Trichonephila clavipes]
MVGQYDDDECSLLMYVHHDATKHGYDNLDAVKRTWIHLKQCRLAIRASRFTIAHTIENASAGDVASRVAAVMVSELRVHDAENVFKQFAQTCFVLKTTPILDSGLLAGLHYFLRPCG